MRHAHCTDFVHNFRQGEDTPRGTVPEIGWAKRGMVQERTIIFGRSIRFMCGLSPAWGCGCLETQMAKPSSSGIRFVREISRTHRVVGLRLPPMLHTLYPAPDRLNTPGLRFVTRTSIPGSSLQMRALGLGIGRCWHDSTFGLNSEIVLSFVGHPLYCPQLPRSGQIWLGPAELAPATARFRSSLGDICQFLARIQPILARLRPSLARVQAKDVVQISTVWAFDGVRSDFMWLRPRLDFHRSWPDFV